MRAHHLVHQRMSNAHTIHNPFPSPLKKTHPKLANIRPNSNSMMPHLAPVAPSTPKPLISAFSRNTVPLLAPPPASHRVSASTLHQTHVQRRDVVLGLAGVVLGLSTGGRNAWAAARRPPPPPPEEKKDPNVTGLAAKILANKKRKEALKETITKLREKGKTIKEPSQ